MNKYSFSYDLVTLVTICALNKIIIWYVILYKNKIILFGQFADCSQIDIYLSRIISWARWQPYLEHLLNGYKVFLVRHRLSIDAWRVVSFIGRYRWWQSEPRKIRSPGERTNKGISCSVSPTCFTTLIKTRRTRRIMSKQYYNSVLNVLCNLDSFWKKPRILLKE